MTSSNKIIIDPSVALTELSIDANYSRDRRLYLANELHQKNIDLAAAQQEIARLNQVIADMQVQMDGAAELDQISDCTMENDQ